MGEPNRVTLGDPGLMQAWILALMASHGLETGDAVYDRRTASEIEYELNAASKVCPGGRTLSFVERRLAAFAEAYRP